MAKEKEHNSGKMKNGIFGVILRIALIPTIALGIILTITSTILTTVQMSNQYIDEAEALNKAYATSVEQLITSLSLSLDAVKNDPSIVDESVSIEDKKAALAIAASSTQFKDFSLAYSDGKTLNNTDISAREYFINALSQKSHYVSSPVLRMTDNTLTVMMGKYFSANGKDYVAYGGLDVDTFNNVIKEVHFGESGICYIVDKDGMVIASSSDQIPVMTNLKEDADNPFASAVDNMLARESGESYVYIDGTPYLFYYTPIEGAEGWSIVTGAATNPILNEIVLTAIIAIIILALAMAANIFIVTNRSRRVCRPIIECAERLEKFANGDINSPAPECKEDNEIRKMAESLALMISTMQGYIGDIHHVLSSISNGDLTVSTNVEYKGDFADIRNSLNLILSSLNKIITSVGRSAHEVSEGANQLSEGSQSLSENAITQASAIEQITSSVISIAEKTESNSQNVKKALELANNTDFQAQEGTQRMKEMLSAITEIEESANEIEHIIKVIDDIAFQTNILALNAAIEAARAGEAGKGFAVVADEVGNLAAKSQNAAKQTGALINKSIEAVKRGAQLADNTSEVLSQIASGVDKVTSLMNEISDANDEQTTAVNQVSAGMENVNAVIHNTTATAEQSAAASEELSALAASLTDEVSQFRTAE